MNDLNIVIEDTFDIKGKPAILMKISSEVMELNIRFEPSELSQMADFTTDQNLGYLKLDARRTIPFIGNEIMEAFIF